ncbi:MAG: hypothetical protein IJO81_06200 [Clostridia bacterium]|nr:hypothetical protein [Clostridia bacterium]
MGKTFEKYVFSERCCELKAGVDSRNDIFRIAEGKFTKRPDDGKRPFEDMFEKHTDEAYIVTFARGIVESWMVSEPVIEPREILLGIPRPHRAIHEHFSCGLYCDTEPCDYDERLADLAPRMFPMDYSYVSDEGVRLMGREAYTAAESCGLWGTGYLGHTVPGFEKLLRVGIGGIVREIDESMERVDPTDTKKVSFLTACRIIMTGLSDWILFYADAAEKKADAAESERDRAELLAAAENARRVAWDVPTNMYEAAQLTWFYALWDTVDSMGRVDRYLYPFYKGSEDDDYVCAIMMKFWEHGVHCVTVGGVTPEGEDATNELSYLLLQILRTIHCVHPRMSVRVHDKMDPALLDLAVTMWSEGFSDPTVVSDKTVISALTAAGAKIEDARDYTILGCQEIEIPGKSNFGCEDGTFSLAKALELTLNHGCDRLSGVRIAPDYGSVCDFKGFDELWDAYVKTVVYLTEIFIKLCSRAVYLRHVNVSKLVKACTTDSCIERALDMDDGGTVYNYGVIETAGSAAAADALYAVKTLVFEEGKIAPHTLEAALTANFEGYEEVRRMLFEAPKFGNGHEGVDKMARDVLEMFWSEIGKYKTPRGDIYTGACALLTGGNHMGDKTWALPDGNFAGSPLGNTIGPRTGSARSGLTSMLRSVASLPLDKGFGGSACNVLIPRDMMDTEEKRDKISGVIRAYLEGGGQMAQITTATLKDMLDARENPDRHRDLFVRVGGYSARFVVLGDYQQEIIDRYSMYGE